MGRCFSTVYRFILVVVGISALTLTILSATSCSFVEFDHQYKSERQLLSTDARRALQADGTEGDAAAPADGTPDDGIPADGTLDDGTPDDGTPDDGTPDDGTPDDGTPDDGTPDGGVPVEGPGVGAPAPDDSALDAVPADAPAPAPADAPEDDGTAQTPILGETQGTTMGEGSPDAIDPAVFSPAPAPVSNPISDSLPTQTNPFPYAPAAEDVAKQQAEEGGDVEEGGTTGTTGASADEGEESTYGEEEESTYGASESSETAMSNPDAAAVVSGDAGLWCDGETSFSITNLWGGSMKDLEDSIAQESNNNQSEEIARSAAVAAAVFGAFALVILLFESIIGWRMCLDKWIVGLVSMMACISQGFTFLFFNSERYCDGDIVHEILNQEPCVLGQGGTFSIIALVLYFLMMIASCRLPQDDPYGLCCKNKDSNKSSGASTTNGSASGSGKFGLLGSKTDTNGSDHANGDPKPERPNWLSEERKKDAEENEII